MTPSEQTTKVAIANRNGSEMAKIRAVIYNGLAISRAFDRPEMFRITHAKSGFGVGDFWPSAMMAYRFAKRLAPLADWTQAKNELVNKELGDKVREIQNEMKKSLQP